jgi:hypothetical protein
VPVISPVLDLALSYRPVLLFHRGDPDSGSAPEIWRPLEILNFLADVPDICTRQSPDPSIDTCELLTNPSTQMPSHNSDQGYLDHVADTGDPECHHDLWTGATVIDCDSGPKTAIYFEPGQDAAAYRYFDYWFFYRDNRPGGTFGQLDDHDGDWEGLTTVLDGLNPNAVALAYVYYAAHNGGAWYGANELLASNSVDPDGRRAKDYVARGTHASYPNACPAACSTPSNVPWPWEAPHDGGAPWGANSDSCAGNCVKRFTDDWWTNWQGRWGGSVGWTNSFGWSPSSPGNQSRFRCAAAGYDASCSGSRPPGSRGPLFVRSAAQAPSPRFCESWFGGSVSVLACDPKLISEAMRKHWMRRPGRLHLYVNGRRAGDSPGLAQAIGEPLAPGAQITLVGKGTPHTIVLMAVRIGLHLYRIQINYENLPQSTKIDLTIGKRGSVPMVRTPTQVVRAKIRRLR